MTKNNIRHINICCPCHNINMRSFFVITLLKKMTPLNRGS